MDKQREVLGQPFNIETHKKTFINYLEVIILEDGTVQYAIPSHQEKLITIACEKLQVTKEELDKMCPKEYYFDFNFWLCQITNCVAVWNTFIEGIPNQKQMDTILLLMKEGLYLGSLRRQHEA